MNYTPVRIHFFMMKYKALKPMIVDKIQQSMHDKFFRFRKSPVHEYSGGTIQQECRSLLQRTKMSKLYTRSASTPVRFVPAFFLEYRRHEYPAAAFSAINGLFVFVYHSVFVHALPAMLADGENFRCGYV